MACASCLRIVGLQRNADLMEQEKAGRSQDRNEFENKMLQMEEEHKSNIAGIEKEMKQQQQEFAKQKEEYERKQREIQERLDKAERKNRKGGLIILGPLEWHY